jgi:hypothetical protein
MESYFAVAVADDAAGAEAQRQGRKDDEDAKQS